MADDYRILVAIDLKTGTDRLLAEARRYGQALNAMVDIIHVSEPDPDFVGYIKGNNPEIQSQLDSEREPHAKVLRLEHQQTQEFGATLRASGVRVDRALTVQGPILETIVQEARKLGADLLILGSHQHGALHRFWYGDTVTGVVKQPPCALLVVPV
ncbi:MAG TPA: universal stress protein [Stellaceae bacterium]|jgi:nucleotide-binding universal stress UspA family protein|nr:universal stress protein [Stellaceae bacterium]